MKTMADIIEHIKDVISGEVEGFVQDKHVAIALGVAQSKLATCKIRNSIPYEEVMDFCARRCISINYLFYGQSPESLVDTTNRMILDKGVGSKRAVAVKRRRAA
ncbi:helix-turn-helix domain-containing protein [Thiomicrolovo sp. ZZH C-3]